MKIDEAQVEPGQVWSNGVEYYLVCRSAMNELVAVALGVSDDEPYVFSELDTALSDCTLFRKKPKQIIKRSVKALLKGEE